MQKDKQWSTKHWIEKLTLHNADTANNRNGLAAPLKLYPGMTNTTSKSKPLWKHKISQQ